jgi:hypothetical protein
LASNTIPVFYALIYRIYVLTKLNDTLNHRRLPEADVFHTIPDPSDFLGFSKSPTEAKLEINIAFPLGIILNRKCL